MGDSTTTLRYFLSILTIIPMVHPIGQLSVNGYMSFATVLDQGPTINVGPEATDWPRQQDPAMIAPFLCKQQVIMTKSGFTDPELASIGTG